MKPWHWIVIVIVVIVVDIIGYNYYQKNKIEKQKKDLISKIRIQNPEIDAPDSYLMTQSIDCLTQIANGRGKSETTFTACDFSKAKS